MSLTRFPGSRGLGQEKHQTGHRTACCVCFETSCPCNLHALCRLPATDPLSLPCATRLHFPDAVDVAWHYIGCALISIFFSLVHMVAGHRIRVCHLLTLCVHRNKDSGVEGFPLRAWSIEIYLLNEHGEQVPANVFDKVTYSLHPSFGDRYKQSLSLSFPSPSNCLPPFVAFSLYLLDCVHRLVSVLPTGLYFPDLTLRSSGTRIGQGT